MLKPTSIRAMNFIVYLKMAMIFVVLVASLSVSKIPEGKIGIVALNITIPILFMVVMLLFIRRRKQFPALITAFIVLWFSNDQIQLILSVVTILLFFLKPTRDYFRSVNAIAPELESVQEEQTEISEEADGETRAEPLPKPQPRSKKDPEVYIREATPEDADTIHTLMHIAFEEFRTAIPPSGALEETSESILEALRDQGESAAILYEDDTATAMVRFKYIDDAIYFFRLSVIPPRRRRGYARQLIKWIEKQGVTKGMNISRCRVRQSVQNNLVLYQDMGYEIVDQELIVRPAGTVKALTMEKKLGIG
ncbi:GNAT family N-acetyltransferase [Cohnella silvisoli]|uniref:GNAT family N-acetyltransferase n=1 Tax=Cohnella silvisoli TaxID=2873699 RepID=A0ABV1KX64_9BACL|nr:GNAT family N-acetyltransferase [Cohnella silvisoli]MCD9024094.1 GNAT family N-acetyltransferase [Cohnella silvisoli]